MSLQSNWRIRMTYVPQTQWQHAAPPWRFLVPPLLPLNLTANKPFQKSPLECCSHHFWWRCCSCWCTWRMPAASRPPRSYPVRWSRCTTRTRRRSCSRNWRLRRHSRAHGMDARDVPLWWMWPCSRVCDRVSMPWPSCTVGFSRRCCAMVGTSSPVPLFPNLESKPRIPRKAKPCRTTIRPRCFPASMPPPRTRNAGRWPPMPPSPQPRPFAKSKFHGLVGGCVYGRGLDTWIVASHKFISRKYVAMTYEKSYWQSQCAWLKTKVDSRVGQVVGVIEVNLLYTPYE